jgi:hypothetical protein
VLGNAPGPTTADRFLRISIGHAATKRRRGSVVGRLLDTFNEDASGVSVPQHSARSVIPASIAVQRERSGENTNWSTGHAGRQEGPTLSAGQILILRLPLTVGPFFCFLFPLGLCTIPLLRRPLGDIVDL